MEIAPQLRPEEQPESTARPLGISRSPRRGVLLEFLHDSEYLKINILQVMIMCEQ